MKRLMGEAFVANPVFERASELHQDKILEYPSEQLASPIHYSYPLIHMAYFMFGNHACMFKLKSLFHLMRVTFRVRCGK
jgi:hypothetical protein